MIEINLLPKDYLKGQRSFALGKTGMYVVAGAIGAIVMLAGITFYQMRQLSSLEDNIERANRRASALKKDIALVDALTDIKGKISSRMAAVERLDRHRSAWVRILEEMAGTVPEFVWLAHFSEASKASKSSQKSKSKDKGKDADAGESADNAANAPEIKRIEVEGYAFTLNSLAAFMINVMRSDYFENVELVKSEEATLGAEATAYNFILSADLHYLSDEELRQLIAQTGADDGSQTGHKELN